jgi:hypothetical protein
VQTCHRRRRRYEFDALERRETPSALMGGALVRTPTSHPTAFQGSGRAVTFSQIPLPDGGLVANGTVSGRAGGLGAFTGPIATTLGVNRLSASSVVVLNAQNGDHLNISFQGSFRTPRSSIEQGSFPFTITGGTGHLAGATGSGTLIEALNTNTGAASFNFSGRITA